MSSKLFRRDNGCFLNEKYIKFKPKMTKNPKFSKFQNFYAIFVKFSTDFVDWKVEKSQQGTNLLSSSLFRRDLGRKISRWSAGVLFLNSEETFPQPKPANSSTKVKTAYTILYLNSAVFIFDLRLIYIFYYLACPYIQLLTCEKNII